MEESIILYEEQPKPLPLKKFHSCILVWVMYILGYSLGLGLFLGSALVGHYPSVDLERIVLLIIFFPIAVFVFIVAFGLVNRFKENRCFRVTSNGHIQLISSLIESFDAEEIEKIVFNVFQGQIVIYTKNKNKIKIPRKDLSDIQNIEHMLEALRRIGVRYDIIRK